MQRDISKGYQFTLKLKVYKLDMNSLTVVPYNMASALSSSVYFIGNGKKTVVQHEVINDYIIIVSNAEWLNTLTGTYSLGITLTDTAGTFTGASPDVLTFVVSDTQADPSAPRKLINLSAATIQADTESARADLFDATWPSEPTNNKAPSTRLAKLALDSKLDITTAATTYLSKQTATDYYVSKTLLNSTLDLIYPIGAIAFGACPQVGTWTRQADNSWLRTS